MANEFKYFVVKDRNDMSITYFEYDKVEGYDLNPKNVKIKDAIDVNKMIVVNPSMIEKLAFKKVSVKFDKLVRMLMFVLSESNDDETGETYREALNYITKLRLEVLTKYKNKLKEEDLETMLKKLDILESEVKLRLNYVISYSNSLDLERTGKSR